MPGTIQPVAEPEAAELGTAELEAAELEAAELEADVGRRDMQLHTRYSLLVPASLDLPDGERPCTLHNISAGGAKIRGEAAPPPGTTLTLRIDAYAFAGEIVWRQGQYAGIGFHEDPDGVQHLIDTELLALPSRLERRLHRRCSVLMSGTLVVDGEPHDCVVKNLSLGGARLSCDHPLAADLPVMLDIKRFGVFPATVVWRHNGEYGLRFTLPPSQVAAMVGDVLPGCISPSEDAPPMPAAAIATNG